MFKPVVFPDRIVDVRPPHQCNGDILHPLCCIDTNGMNESVLELV